MLHHILSLSLENELDIILVHKRASQLGGLAGLSYSEQTRFATAISEISRNSIDLSDKGEVCFEIRKKKNVNYLLCTIIDRGPEIDNLNNLFDKTRTYPVQSREAGLINAMRLVVFFNIESDSEKGAKIVLGFPVKIKIPINKELVDTWVRSLKEQPVSPYEELKYRNLQLLTLYEELQKLISMISHDLRSPVASLMTSAEILQNNIKDFDQETLERFTKIINNSSHKIYDQLNELVEWAKLQNQKKLYYPVKIQLSQILEDSLEIIEDAAKNKKIDIINQVEDSIYVNADPLMLRSIFQNLITNSVKFTPGGGAVKISAEKHFDMVEISIEDNGVGMSDEVKDNLFDLSFVTREGTDRESGSGLGMKLVNDFVNKHQGEISIESETNKGTTIKFTIPVSKN